MNILQITALLCITQLAISTAAPSASLRNKYWQKYWQRYHQGDAPEANAPYYRDGYYPRNTPDQENEKSPSLGDGEKLHEISIFFFLFFCLFLLLLLRHDKGHVNG